VKNFALVGVVSTDLFMKRSEFAHFVL